MLRPGGVFVNAEHVAAPTPLLEARYEIWHEHASLALGASEQEWAGAVERMSHDLKADVPTQLSWLERAGFVDVDCLFKRYGFAVIFARRAGS